MFFFQKKSANIPIFPQEKFTFTHSVKIRGRKKNIGRKNRIFNHSLEFCPKGFKNKLFQGNKKIRYLWQGRGVVVRYTRLPHSFASGFSRSANEFSGLACGFSGFASGFTGHFALLVISKKVPPTYGYFVFVFFLKLKLEYFPIKKVFRKTPKYGKLFFSN